jgi:hypothetical protein
MESAAIRTRCTTDLRYILTAPHFVLYQQSLGTNVEGFTMCDDDTHYVCLNSDSPLHERLDVLRRLLEST